MIKPHGPTAPREEYKRYETEISDSALKRKQENTRAKDEVPAMRAREMEIAERKTRDMLKLLNRLSEARHEGHDDHSDYFRNVAVIDSETTVLNNRGLTSLSEAVLNLANMDCFSALPLEKVLFIQSLSEPSIAATGELPQDLTEGDIKSWLDMAQSGLKASELVLLTMVHGAHDRRICSEDTVRDIIRALKHVLDMCIIPIVESRRNGSTSDLFQLALANKSEMHSVLRSCGRVFSFLATLIGKVNLGETALSPIEYITFSIIFVQNGENEKESALEIKRFEAFRQKAMDVLVQIFACHIDQRNSITIEVLNNLEKLPDKRASARQFKSSRETPIMLVSAFFMRIVQAAACRNSQEERSRVQSGPATPDDGDESEDSESETEHRRSKKAARNATSRNPSEVSSKLMEDATRVALDISNWLVTRARNVSKSGDKPFRNLLDLFIEDFCNVLGSPEWPAAALLLEKLLGYMINIVQNSSKEVGVPDKDMALAILGRMGGGMIDFGIRLKQHRRGLDISQSELSNTLVRLADDAFENSINNHDLLGLQGPYWVVLDALPRYLKPEANQDDPHLQSVKGCHVTFWMYAFTQAFQSEGDEPRPKVVETLEGELRKMVMDPDRLSREYRSQNVTDAQRQLAAGIVTLQSAFCKYLPGVITTLINNTKNSSAMLKARAMGSLTQLIEKDPRIINEQTFVSITRLLGDQSPKVRENTVSLISKCLEQTPALERHCLGSILQLINDPANGPKKRAIKLLKDIYLGATSKENKLSIATCLLVSVQDDDKAISDLTCQTLEDIWLAPESLNARSDDNQRKLGRDKKVSLLVDTVQKIQDHPAHLEAFETFFAQVLSDKAKNSTTNFKICKDLVAVMVEGVIGTESAAGEKSQARILQTLSILAKVNPHLFTSDQIQLLKLYVKALANTGDLPVLRPTVTIFRYVFPSLPSFQEQFAEEVRAALNQTVSKLAGWAAQRFPTTRETLLDVAHCLWMISPLVKGEVPSAPQGILKLMTMICSVVVQLEPYSNGAPKKPSAIISYLTILGVFGKVCDFDQYIDLWKRTLFNAAHKVINAKQMTADQLKRLLEWKGNSVSAFLLEGVRPFTMQSWDMSIREQALRSVGEISQQSPKMFMRADVEKAFKLVFINQDNQDLKRAVLIQFRDFFASAERRSETGAEIAVGQGAVAGAARLDTSFAASDNDSATLHLAQKFLSDIVGIALGKTDDLALLATNIIISISRQGLVHPKEVGPALIALETSPVPHISQKAFLEHQKIHLQHETMFEKEYMTAVAQAYAYQRDVCNDSHGLTTIAFKPKMHLLFNVLKMGGRKTLKKFLTNICKQIDFELPKLDCTGAVPDVVLFARFCLENLGLFDYAKVDEIVQLTSSLESIVLKHTGPAVALAIETEMPLHIPHPVQQLQKLEVEGAPVINAPSEDLPTDQFPEARLRQLTVACMTLQMMWETRSFIKRIYNMQGKITAKDFQKPATRMNFVSGKELWDRMSNIMTSLDSRDNMIKQCRDFAELLEVDREAKFDDDEDASDQLAKAAAGYETPDEEANGPGPAAPTSGRGRKRKGSVVGGSTPKKSRGRSKKTQSRKGSKTPDRDDWD
jgi:cohesin loading factor subunit SCC2